MNKLNTVFFVTALAVTSFMFTASPLQSMISGKRAQQQLAQATSTQNTDQGTQSTDDNQNAQEKPGTIPNSMLPRREPFQDHSADKSTDSMTIVEIVSANPSLSTLSKAIKSADLAKALSGPGPFTIFAPSDAAFARLSPNALSDLLSPDNKDKLKAILTYHVVPGKITADNFKNMKVRTINGKPLEIKVNGDDVTVNNAKVNTDNITGANGIIYITDTVLQP